VTPPPNPAANCPFPPEVQPLPPRSASLTTPERHWADRTGPLYPGMMT